MENSSNKDSHLPKPYVPKVRQYPQEWTFPRHTSATCPECALFRLVQQRPSPWPYAHTARKRKIWWKTRFRCYLRLSAQRTWNQDGLLRDATLSKVTHHQPITKFPNRRPECVHFFDSSTVVLLLICHAALYFRLNTYQEIKTLPK